MYRQASLHNERNRLGIGYMYDQLIWKNCPVPGRDCMAKATAAFLHDKISGTPVIRLPLDDSLVLCSPLVEPFKGDLATESCGDTSCLVQALVQVSL